MSPVSDTCSMLHVASVYRALGGPRRNIAIKFRMEKLEWFGYVPDGEQI